MTKFGINSTFLLFLTLCLLVSIHACSATEPGLEPEPGTQTDASETPQATDVASLQADLLRAEQTMDVALLDQTIARLRRATAENPNDPQALALLYIALGDKVGKLGHSKEALDELPNVFERLTSLAPTVAERLPSVSFFRGTFYVLEAADEKSPTRQKELTDKARRSLQQAVRERPDMGRPHYQLGLYYFWQSDYELAANELDKASTLEPDFPLGRELAGKNALKMIHLPEDCWDQAAVDSARHHLLEAIRLNPHDADAHALMASALVHSGDFELAVFEHEAAHQIEPTPERRRELGIAKLRAGDVDAGIYDLQQAISEDPKNVRAFRYLANAYLARLDYQAAVAEYDKAGEIGDETYVYDALYASLALEALGQTDKRQTRLNRCRADCERDDWEGELLDYAAGRTGRDELLSRATNRCQRTEAYYFIGMQAIARGDRIQGKKDLVAVVNQDVHCYVETFMANITLELLQPKG